jgi:hypothetical protein
MEGLLLINFERDPDKSYVEFEPQVFDAYGEVKGQTLSPACVVQYI